jgi:hypothetical protein
MPLVEKRNRGEREGKEEKEGKEREKREEKRREEIISFTLCVDASFTLLQ